LKFSWEQRIARAGELAQKHPAVAELLKFYQHLARVQKSIDERLRSLGEHHLPVLLPFFSELVSLVKREGSPSLRQAAQSLTEDLDKDRLALLESIWQHQVQASDLAGEYAFFAQALLQPYAEFLAGQAGLAPPAEPGATAAPPHQVNPVAGSPAAAGSPSLCPFCGSRPQVAVLRPEGDGAKRSLLCSLCATEWIFRRVLCPNCGEEDREKLPVFTAKEFEHVRVDACDTCHTYIKSIDLTKNGRAVPMVDELATVSLNLWAQEKNYKKLRPNLFGV
jgi:FdhE protein